MSTLRVYQLSAEPLFADPAPLSVASSTSGSEFSIDDDDNQIIAEHLGITNINELKFERFQIDRRKLQKMYKTYLRGLNSAEAFFENIQRTTKTYINWPRNLENEFKNKKDPFIQVFGRADDLSWAKGLIESSLFSEGGVVKLKMAISNSEHIFVFGREFNNIHRIMNETDTYIRFSDSSQINNSQVSIYGNLEGLKRARALLRQSTPLVMSFELHTVRLVPAISNVEARFDVRVQVLTSTRSNSTVVLVKGYSERPDRVSEAIKVLINSTCGRYVPDTLVSVQLEISPQYQESIKGDDNANILIIMENTKTKIFFPDLAMRGTTKQRSQVTITGTIDGVRRARDELISHLPLELTFDIPGELQGHGTEILKLGKKFGVCITLSQKERDDTMAVTIKGPEKCIDKIYEVHHDIFHIKETLRPSAKLPKALDMLDGAYQRVMGSVVNTYVENVVERTNATLSECNQSRMNMEGLHNLKTMEPIPNQPNLTQNQFVQAIANQPHQHFLQNLHAQQNLVVPPRDYLQFMQSNNLPAYDKHEPIDLQQHLQHRQHVQHIQHVQHLQHIQHLQHLQHIQYQQINQQQPTYTPDSGHSSDSILHEEFHSNGWIVYSDDEIEADQPISHEAHDSHEVINGGMNHINQLFGLGGAEVRLQCDQDVNNEARADGHILRTSPYGSSNLDGQNIEQENKIMFS